MTQYQLFAVVILTIVSAFSVEAQSNSTTCQVATAMANVNGSLFAGEWYEEVRAPAKNISCVRITVTVVNNQTQLNVTTHYSPSKSGLQMTKFDQAIVNISQINANNGFVVSNSNSNISTTYKILSTDYRSNVVLCGYTNAKDSLTSFGIILTRDQIPNSSWLLQLQSNASQFITGFNDSSAVNITQSSLCKINSASTSLPALTTLFAAFYVLFKFAF